MEYYPFDSDKAYEALGDGQQVRVRFSSGEEYGFQTEKSSSASNITRTVYQKTRNSNPSKFTNLAITTLIETLTSLNVEDMIILPRDWCSLSEVPPPIISSKTVRSPTTKSKVIIKDKLVFDQSSGTILGYTIDGKAHTLNPSIISVLLKKYDSSRMYHVSVLGRDINSPLGKKEFLKTISDLKRN